MADQAPNHHSDDFSSLFEFLPIGAYRSTPGGQMVRANPALARLNGFASAQDLLAGVTNIGGHWYVDPARRQAFQDLLERDGHVTAFESEVYRYKTRERIWINENAHVVRNAAGQVQFYEGTVEEITARVRESQALQQSEARLQQLIALIPGAVYRMAFTPDGERHYTFMSQGVRGLYGIDPQEALTDGRALTRRRHPDEAARIHALTEAAIAAGTALAGETRIQLDDGSEKWIQVLSTPAPDEGGQRTRVGLLFDITAAKLAEQALQDNSQLWKRALESSGDGVWDWHVQDGVEMLSAPCRALYGYNQQELPDHPDALDALTHPDDLPRMRSDREAHFAGRTPSYVNEHRVRCKDGSWKWILSRGIAISRDASGAPLRIVGTHTDITAAKQADALRHERDRAAAADHAKSQFLSRVSHELRTPLNAILGFAQLLEIEPGDGERQLGWTRHVLASGRHLLALMDDILDLSSVQTGRLAMAIETVPLKAAVEEAWTMLAATAQAQQVALINELRDTAALSVQADRRRLKQVLSNLLSNAVKYNRPGGWVRVVAQPQGGMVAIQIIDSGPGLSDAQQGRLFNAFDRLGAERGPVAGTGLGLALTRQLAEAMGGSVGVQSRPDEGATFTVRLPAPPAV